MVRSFRRFCQDNDIRVIKSTTLEIYTDSEGLWGDLGAAGSLASLPGIRWRG